MDASELLTVAMDAMPLMVLEAADQGQVYGVLSMALRTLEAQHATLLAEADEEAASAIKVITEVTKERDDYRERCNLMAAEIDAKQNELDEQHNRIDNLNAENARLHRSMEEWMSAAQHAQAVPPGAVQVK